MVKDHICSLLTEFLEAGKVLGTPTIDRGGFVVGEDVNPIPFIYCPFCGAELEG